MSLGIANLLRQFPVQLQTRCGTTILCDALAVVKLAVGGLRSHCRAHVWGVELSGLR